MYDRLLTQAHALALKAKPWVLTHNGKVYTAVYSMRESIYEVYEDGFLVINVNLKSPAKAKKFLLHWLTN
jgi:hypothetical protein